MEMKRRWLVLAIALFFMVGIVSACGDKDDNNNNNNNDNNNVENEDNNNDNDDNNNNEDNNDNNDNDEIEGNGLKKDEKYKKKTTNIRTTRLMLMQKISVMD